MQGAVAWLTTYVNDDHGVGEYAAQYKTTDEHAHLQGESAKGLFEKYKEWMEDKGDHKGSSLPPQCEIGTFRSALAEMAKIPGVMPHMIVS